MTDIVILAAGKGSRLYPFTKNLPKCLLDFKGKSILERQLDVYKKFNINNIIIVTLGINLIKLMLKT